MKITNDLKFRFVDSNLKKEEIEKLSSEDWKKLYNYQNNRDRELINVTSNFSGVLLKATIIFISFLIASVIIGLIFFGGSQ